MKQCSKCHEIKSTLEFYSGRTDCKECKSRQVVEHQKANKTWLIRYDTNPAEYHERNRRNYERLKNEKPDKLLEYRANKNRKYYENKKQKCA